MVKTQLLQLFVCELFVIRAEQVFGCLKAAYSLLAGILNPRLPSLDHLSIVSSRFLLVTLLSEP